MAICTSNPLKCSQVEISGTGISEIHGKRVVVALPREQIRQVTLCHDSSARHPFSQYFLGYVLLIFGMLGLLVDFLASAGGALIHIGHGEFVLPLIPITHWVMIGVGFWLLRGVFRARYHLLVETERGKRKVFFEKNANIEDIQRFARMAQLLHGYTIDLSVLKKSSTPS
ncbi:MAG: hypothetical protein M0017_04950 [Desulfobacteraceae bacterium]|nr:hypothetical protein [Desulfobacteraceae bacterium]